MISKQGGGERLKAERKKLGITQKELAARLGLSSGYISLIETGNQPLSEPIAQSMKRYYGSDPRWLLYGITPAGETTRLRQVRDDLGMKQKDLAARLGISAQYLGLMERNEQPISVPVAQKLQSLYGYSAEWIIFGTGDWK